MEVIFEKDTDPCYDIGSTLELTGNIIYVTPAFDFFNNLIPKPSWSNIARPIQRHFYIYGEEIKSELPFLYSPYFKYTNNSPAMTLGNSSANGYCHVGTHFNTGTMVTSLNSALLEYSYKLKHEYHSSISSPLDNFQLAIDHILDRVQEVEIDKENFEIWGMVP